MGGGCGAGGLSILAGRTNSGQPLSNLQSKLKKLYQTMFRLVLGDIWVRDCLRFALTGCQCFSFFKCQCFFFKCQSCLPFLPTEARTTVMVLSGWKGRRLKDPVRYDEQQPGAFATPGNPTSNTDNYPLHRRPPLCVQAGLKRSESYGACHGRKDRIKCGCYPRGLYPIP